MIECEKCMPFSNRDIAVLGDPHEVQEQHIEEHLCCQFKHENVGGVAVFFQLITYELPEQIDREITNFFQRSYRLLQNNDSQ